ncbi:MAG: type I-F CRISPR-associated endoribonuclease Cas6/Csy4 [Methyloprofundus sp.]|nr:type I-F CRISPR-associated endoribonuclease Cas6/Csy4 [Methyloprofundus sp.]
MKYYLDITLLPDTEISLGFLWQKVYQQLHLALVENKIAENESVIAVSIPEYGNKQFPLGDKIRLLSQTKTQLQQLDIEKWLNRLTDYTHFKPIKEVPSSVNQFARFKRKQFDTNAERLARRRAKRKGESLEQAVKHFVGFASREANLPFLNMKSLTNEDQFKLFIEREVVNTAENGNFSCYGLSKGATVPLF